MDRDDERHELASTLSEHSSLAERNSTREQNLWRENTRLRSQHSEISEKYIQMCNELSKMQAKLIDRERKISELDTFYNKEIENLKRELSAKAKQLEKLTRLKSRRLSDASKQNVAENFKDSIQFQSCLENQSIMINQVQNENIRINELLTEALELIQPYVKDKAHIQVQRKITAIRKELAHKKGSLDSAYAKTTQMLKDAKNKPFEGTSNEIPQLFQNLKNKLNFLRKTPLILDYDIQGESNHLEGLFNHLDQILNCEKSHKVGL